ncbi:MAG: hypothetical protein AAGG48_09430 [Planctomycetota bacterium]
MQAFAWWFLGLVEYVLGWVVELFIWLVSYAFFTCLEWIWELVRPLLEGLVADLPNIEWGDFSTLATAFTVGDHWLPLTECFALLTAYHAFVVTFAIVKIIIKIIPTVG